MTVKINDFPSKTELQRVSTLRKYQKLNENEQMAVLGLHQLIKDQYKNVADLVYLSHAVPARITEFYGDFVQGDVDRLIVQTATDSDADQEWIDSVVYENDLKEKVADFAEDQSEYGYVVFLGFTDEENKYHIETVPADQYFPQPDGSVVFVTYKKDPKFPDGSYHLAHTQHYQIENGKVFIEHQAFRANKQGVMIESIGLDVIGNMIGRTLEAKEEIEGIDELPIRQVDNGRRSRWGFGKSDYCDIIPQLAEINERTTHAATQFLKNVDAKMVIPASSLEEDEEGNTKIKHQEAYVVESKEDPIPQYITNTNPLIDQAREHVLGQLKFVEWVTGVPMWALTKGTMVERVESLRIQLFTAMRKTAKKRAKIKRGLLDMFRIGAKMTDQSEELKTQDVVMDFGDALPVDELQQVQVESEKIRSGISSKRSSMKRIENYDDERVDEEMAAIKSEDAIAGIGQPENAPTI